MKKLLFLFMILTASFANATNKTLNIYKLANAPVIDGSAADWGSDWIDIAAIKPGNTTSQCTAKFQIGYTTDSLYVIVQVQDPTPNNSTSIGGTYLRDCVELFVKLDTTTQSIGAGSTQYRFQRDGSVLEKNSALINAQTVNLATSYTQEWALPWADIAAKQIFPLDMTTLDYIRFDIQVADNTDGTGNRTQQLFWNAGTDSQYSSMKDYGFLHLMGAKTAAINQILENKAKIIYNSSKNTLSVFDYCGAIQVFDTTGKLILKNTSTNGNIKLPNIKKGVYIVTGNGFTTRFVK